MSYKDGLVTVFDSSRKHQLKFVSLGVLLALGSMPQVALAQQQPNPGLPEAPVVHAPAGPVQGITNKGVYEYLGIPYAEPPVGPLRWRPPQPYPAWSQTRKAAQFCPTCAQVTTTGVFSNQSTSEDCIYVNVFTPSVRLTRNLPVMIWVHGGGNYDGESNDYMTRPSSPTRARSLSR